MPELIVAYDYICPWCWIAWKQAKRLTAEFSTLELRWKGYELLPEGLAYTPATPDPAAPKKPRTPGRLELLEFADELRVPKRTRTYSHSRLALEGAEFAFECGKANEYHEVLYHGYWEEQRDIADKAVLMELAEAAGLDVAKFMSALETRIYRERVVEFDEPAHAAGIWNVPTWQFPEEWVAEQPYVVLREMTERFIAGEDVSQ